jgi:hypothetical protein
VLKNGEHYFLTSCNILVSMFFIQEKEDQMEANGQVCYVLDIDAVLQSCSRITYIQR